MNADLFEYIFLIGVLVATIVRTSYGLQFRRREVVATKKEHPLVFAGMALWGVALLLPLVSIYSFWIEFSDYHIPIPLRVIGALIFICGLWLLWRSHADLARNFSPSLFIRKDHKLVTNGVYKRIRHPMYLAFWLWAIGQALLIPNWLSGPMGILAFLSLYSFRVRREELQLLEHFGDEYREYQKRTGRVFPKIKPC
jgi:protein-S-isoprenylcysteine O-methyltransferase Ste14